MRTISAVAAILAIAAVATGCGGTGGAGESTSEKTKPTVAIAEPPPGTTPTAEDGAAIAARSGQIDGDAVRLEIVQLRRSGGTTALTFRLTSSADESASAQIATTFSDGVVAPQEGGILGSATLDGISLIDAQNRKRYLVARDSEGKCVCDGNLAHAFVKAAAPTLLSATFGAPPDEVDAVDVVIPRFGTFKDVPLS